jgi:GT2 family glycosyltransferase
MSAAPIILFIYNRPWHTQQTIEALAANKGANEAHLYVFADGPKADANQQDLQKIKEARQYIKNAKAF